MDALLEGKEVDNEEIKESIKAMVRLLLPKDGDTIRPYDEVEQFYKNITEKGENPLLIDVARETVFAKKFEIPIQYFSEPYREALRDVSQALEFIIKEDYESAETILDKYSHEGEGAIRLDLIDKYIDYIAEKFSKTFDEYYQGFKSE